MKYIFGPVPSRRLGFSLGVDIIPYKTCSFDCIYCELGKTLCKTIEAVDQIRPEAVLDELRAFMDQPATTIDFITVSGSGEPTLHPDLGVIIREIKKMAKRPVALITNASLLFRDEILNKVLEADIIVPSLDAVDSETFETVNKPHPDLTFDNLLTGLKHLGLHRQKRIWLEILLLRGINDAPEQIDQFRQVAQIIDPEKIQLNTVVRPPVEDYALPVEEGRLQGIQKMLGAKAEVIGRPLKDQSQPEGSMIESEIRAMVARRPCTAEDIAQCLGLPLEKTMRFLNDLEHQNKICLEKFNQQDFYRVN
jgi:wyosine [tRNA(Phe)-imidazoG37] synthetase (radical SAM superfamily)